MIPIPISLISNCQIENLGLTFNHQRKTISLFDLLDNIEILIDIGYAKTDYLTNYIAGLDIPSGGLAIGLDFDNGDARMPLGF